MDGFDIGTLAEKFSGWIWAIPLFFLLLGCGLLFSIISKFIQIRILTHGYSCIRGHYDRPDDTGHINHFQALCAALSATIGLGNIAGVAVAVSLGGPGAVFWMWVVGVLGMALKFMECTLAVMYRDVRDVPDPSAPALTGAEDRTPDSAGKNPPAPGTRREVRGGPMWYMQKALVEPLKAKGNGLWVVFKVLAVLFAVSTILNSFGGGNMFQGWNVADMLQANFQVPRIASATVVSVLVALVIIGGIKRIGAVASKLVPLMCVVYVGGTLYVIIQNASQIPECLALIVRSALTPAAEAGAFTGVTVWIAFTWGLKRACFSNEAGEGSAAMAHAAARTDEPVREGIVAGLGPFIDTIIICTISALVLLMSDTTTRPPVGEVVAIEGNLVRVTCQPDVPERMVGPYVDRMVVGKNLSIHLLRAVDKTLEKIEAPIVELDRGEGDDWSSFRGVVLDISGATSEERAKIQVGKPVHVGIDGAEMTAFAFDTSIRGFGKYMVTLAVCLFAFSTMISWSYYGEKGAEYLLGARAILPYKFIFVVFVFVGMVIEKFQTVFDFSDATTGLMVLCNLPAVLILSPVVIRAAKDYFHRLDSGQMPRRK